MACNRIPPLPPPPLRLQLNGFSFSEDPDAPPGRRLRLTAVPVSKNVAFGAEGPRSPPMLCPLLLRALPSLCTGLGSACSPLPSPSPSPRPQTCTSCSACSPRLAAPVAEVAGAATTAAGARGPCRRMFRQRLSCPPTRSFFLLFLSFFSDAHRQGLSLFFLSLSYLSGMCIKTSSLSGLCIRILLAPRKTPILAVGGRPQRAGRRHGAAACAGEGDAGHAGVPLLHHDRHRAGPSSHAAVIDRFLFPLSFSCVR